MYLNLPNQSLRINRKCWKSEKSDLTASFCFLLCFKSNLTPAHTESLNLPYNDAVLQEEPAVWRKILLSKNKNPPTLCFHHCCWNASLSPKCSLSETEGDMAAHTHMVTGGGGGRRGAGDLQDWKWLPVIADANSTKRRHAVGKGSRSQARKRGALRVEDVCLDVRCL